MSLILATERNTSCPRKCSVQCIVDVCNRDTPTVDFPDQPTDLCVEVSGLAPSTGIQQDTQTKMQFTILLCAIWDTRPIIHTEIEFIGDLCWKRLKLSKILEYHDNLKRMLWENWWGLAPSALLSQLPLVLLTQIDNRQQFGLQITILTLIGATNMLVKSGI